MIGLTVSSIGTLPTRQHVHPGRAAARQPDSHRDHQHHAEMPTARYRAVAATGISRGPKMIRAAAPSSTEPITIRIAIDRS